MSDVLWARRPVEPAVPAARDEPAEHQKRESAGRGAPRGVRRTSAVVAVLILVVTGVLSFLASGANAASDHRLLQRQLAQVGSLLTSQAAVLQVELADIAEVAVKTHADPDIFASWAAGELKQTGQSVSLWRITGGHAERLAVQGVEPRLPADGPAALTVLKPNGKLTVLGILPGRPDRLAYALMPGGGNTDLAVYAESPLPPGRRLAATTNSPVSGLDLAIYLGRRPVAARLLESTGPTPVSGDTATKTVPFGNTSVTVVGASRSHLSGALSANLQWIVLGVGCMLAAVGAIMVETLARRRVVAEHLAGENHRLYREQRDIAGTLQHALLPAVPQLDGIDVAARYLAGVAELEVGGDWYDVIPRGPGRCAFVVGDISGRGLPAATTMAALRFALRAYLAQGDDIATALSRLRGLLDVNVDHQFATVLLGEVDTGAGRISLVSAGHFPPLLLTDGAVNPIDCPVAPPVGVAAPEAMPPAVVHVSGPTTLLAFTDGLVERRGEVIDAGIDRLRNAVAATDSRPLPAVLDEVLERLTIDGGRDDTVLLGMRWTSEPDPRPRDGT